MANTEEKPRIKLTYAHRVETTKNKIGYKYYDENDNTKIYSSKLAKNEVPGSIIEVTDRGDDTISGPYKIVDSIKDAELVADWQNKDRLNVLEYNTAKAKLKTHDNYYEKNVKELAKQYNDLPYNLRSIFIIKLIDDIKRF